MITTAGKDFLQDTFTLSERYDDQWSWSGAIYSSASWLKIFWYQDLDAFHAWSWRTCSSAAMAKWSIWTITLKQWPIQLSVDMIICSFRNFLPDNRILNVVGMNPPSAVLCHQDLYRSMIVPISWGVWIFIMIMKIFLEDRPKSAIGTLITMLSTVNNLYRSVANY